MRDTFWGLLVIFSLAGQAVLMSVWTQGPPPPIRLTFGGEPAVELGLTVRARDSTGGDWTTLEVPESGPSGSWRVPSRGRLEVALIDAEDDAQRMLVRASVTVGDAEAALDFDATSLARGAIFAVRPAGAPAEGGGSPLVSMTHEVWWGGARTAIEAVERGVSGPPDERGALARLATVIVTSKERFLLKREALFGREADARVLFELVAEDGLFAHELRPLAATAEVVPVLRGGRLVELTVPPLARDLPLEDSVLEIQATGGGPLVRVPLTVGESTGPLVPAVSRTDSGDARVTLRLGAAASYRARVLHALGDESSIVGPTRMLLAEGDEPLRQTVDGTRLAEVTVPAPSGLEAAIEVALIRVEQGDREWDLPSPWDARYRRVARIEPGTEAVFPSVPHGRYAVRVVGGGEDAHRPDSVRVRDDLTIAWR